MTKKQVCEIFTKKVVEYIGNGYIITPDSFSGSDGTSRVDLVKDDSFIRIYLNEVYECGGDILTFVVCEKKLTSNISKKRIYSQDIIWTNDMTVVEETDFRILNKYSKNIWYVTEEEYREIMDRTKDRRNNRVYNFGYTKVRLPEEAKKIVLSFIQRKPKCKSVKVKDIKYVEKYINFDNVHYRVSCKGHVYELH